MDADTGRSRALETERFKLQLTLSGRDPNVPPCLLLMPFIFSSTAERLSMLPRVSRPRDGGRA